MTPGQSPAPGPRDLHDDGGRLIARVMVVDRGDWRQADVERLEAGVGVDVAADVMRRDFAGMRIATLDGGLARALVDRGGAITRAGTQMELDLVNHPPPPEWLHPSLPAGAEMTTYAAHADVAAARAVAYGPAHPDHDPRRESGEYGLGELRRILGGEVTGPVLDAASRLVRHDGGVVGAILVTLMPRNALWGGPWITDVFVVPAHQGSGLGTALMRYAAAAAARDGHPGIALTVSLANPARRLYERLGFKATHAFSTVALP